MLVRRRPRRFVLGPLAVALAAMGLEVMPSDPRPSPDLEAIRTAGRAVRPFHPRKVPPRPGDWFERHREPGQTFDVYRASDPNRPTAERTTI